MAKENRTKVKPPDFVHGDRRLYVRHVRYVAGNEIAQLSIVAHHGHLTLEDPAGEYLGVRFDL